MPLISTLQDDFDSGTIDTTRWPTVTGAVVVSQRCRITCDTGFNEIVSGALYTLEDSAVYCRVYPAAAGGSTDCWTQMTVKSTTAGTDLCFEYDADAGLLRFSNRVGFFDAGATTLAYSATDHRWWRIREAGAQTFFETSANGTAWTTRRTITTPAWVETQDTLALQLITHRADGTSNYAEFDNVNLPPITYGTAAFSFGGLSLAASGKRTAKGSATFSFGGTLTITGKGHHYGTAAFSFGGSLRANGRAITLSPLITRQRWQILAGPRTGGYETALTSPTNRKLSVRLEDASQLTFDLDGLEEEANALSELVSDLHVLWRGDEGTVHILYRGRLGTTRDDVGEDSHTIQCTSLDYRGLLGRRILYSGDTLTYTGVDQGEIAWALVSATQSKPGGHLGISKGWAGTTPTGHAKDWEFAAGDGVGEMVRKVAENENGFNWDIVPTSASALQFRVWSPQRGTDKGVVLEHGGLATSVLREVNPQSYANAIRYTGADGLIPVEAATTDIATTDEGRWDAVHGDSSLEIQECVDERAAWQLAEAATVRPTYTVVLAEGEWYGPDHIWLGDPVRLIVASGRLAVDATLRVYGIDFDISDEGPETVTLTLDRPPTPPDRLPSITERRLVNLERR